MIAYLRDCWDLLGGSLVACLLLGLLLAWHGACTVITALVAAPIAAIVLVFCGLWALALAGGSVPW